MSNKLNIGLIGYGKMGKTIEKLAIEKGHNILLRICSSNLSEFNDQNISKLDVAIEFTTPKAAPKNLEILAANSIPTVCGSTAWLDKYDEIVAMYKSNNTPFIYASNFSVGVNVMFAVNTYLAKIMRNLGAYDVAMTEIHHIEKKDAPSGTAVTLADQIINQIPTKVGWKEGQSDDNRLLAIEALREPDVKGTHIVKYTSAIDEISLKHEAFSREGFAKGALLAAEFLIGKEGIFTMEDVLDI